MHDHGCSVFLELGWLSVILSFALFHILLSRRHIGKAWVLSTQRHIQPIIIHRIVYCVRNVVKCLVQT
jgi:hypothetical protein